MNHGAPLGYGRIGHPRPTWKVFEPNSDANGSLDSAMALELVPVLPEVLLSSPAPERLVVELGFAMGSTIQASRREVSTLVGFASHSSESDYRWEKIIAGCEQETHRNIPKAKLPKSL